MRYLETTVFAFLVMLATSSRAKTDNAASFETWEDYISYSIESHESPSNTPPPFPVAKSSVADQDTAQAASVTQATAPPPIAEKRSEDSPKEYLIHFGAGARWLVPVRISDGSREDSLLSVFSVSVAPFRIIGEVGIDLSMGKDSSFFLEPNLKFFFVKHETVSIYLQGAFAVYSQSSGTYLGGGAGLGVVGGIMKHLAIEFRASAVLLNLNGADSASLLNTAPDSAGVDKTLLLCPSLEARLMARF